MDWLGNVFIVLGLWGIGNRSRGAFVFSMVGEGLWIAFSVRAGLYSLAAICCVFFVMAARNWVLWGKPTPGTPEAK